MPLSTLLPFALVAVIGIVCFMQRSEPELERSAIEQLAKESGHACRQVLSAGRLRWPMSPTQTQSQSMIAGGV